LGLKIILILNCSSNFPSDKYPSFSEAKRNVALVLSNHHFSEGAIRPHLPNMVEVGGLTIKEKPDPLPLDIQKWIDGAEHGVIFFSLGSNVKSSTLSEEKVRIFLKTFSKIKQRVLWKWETKELPMKLDNVMTSKWLPQDDILGKQFLVCNGLKLDQLISIRSSQKCETLHNPWW
jgi:glucuronosyltransferase